MRNPLALATVAAVAVAALVGAGACSSSSREKMIEKLKPRPPCPPPTIARGAWRHTRSRAIAAVAAPRHATTDVVVGENQEIIIGGKVAYGQVSKDLEDEEIVMWMEDGDCNAVEVARGITDDDGRARLAIAARPPGTYQFWLFVVADGTGVAGTVYVVPPGRTAVLFDIDGTLTTSDAELFEDLAGQGPAAMFPDAEKVAHHWADRDHLIVYITGRPYLLHARTRTWLVANKLPPGPLITTDYVRQAIPSQGGVGLFKTETIRRLVEGGVDFVRAYGNASTDVCAYARVGIAPDRTYIVGADPRRCDDHPPTRPLPSYTEHLRELGSNPAAR